MVVSLAASHVAEGNTHHNARKDFFPTHSHHSPFPSSIFYSNSLDAMHVSSCMLVSKTCLFFLGSHVRGGGGGVVISGILRYLRFVQCFMNYVQIL